MIPVVFIVFFVIAFLLRGHLGCLGIIIMGVVSLLIIVLLAHAYS